MSDEQPEVRWAPIEPKPKSRGRIWLIVGIAVATLAIVGALLFFLLPRGDAPEPGASGTPSPSAEAPAETPGPALTPPAPEEPSLDEFRTQVTGWLTDAPLGLDIVAGSNGADALPVIDSLIEDAQRLSDSMPPSSIAPQWREGVTAYMTRLTELRAAVVADSGVTDSIDAARGAVQDLRETVGL